MNFFRRRAERHEPPSYRARDGNDRTGLLEHAGIRLGMLLQNAGHCSVITKKINDQRDVEPAARVNRHDPGGPILSQDRCDTMATEGIYVSCSCLSLKSLSRHASEQLVKHPARQ